MIKFLLSRWQQRKRAKLSGRLFISGNPKRSRKVVTAPIASTGVPVSFPRQYELARQWLATNMPAAEQIATLKELERK